MPSMNALPDIVKNNIIISNHIDDRYSHMVVAKGYQSPFELLTELVDFLGSINIVGIIVFDLLLSGNKRKNRFFTSLFNGSSFEDVNQVSTHQDIYIHAKCSAPLLKNTFDFLNTSLLSKAEQYAISKGIVFPPKERQEVQKIPTVSLDYGDDFLHVKEDYLINSETGMLVENYLHGRCEIFALCMSEKLGLEVGAIIQENPVDGSHPFLVHAFCFHPIWKDSIIDAKGIRALSEIYSEYGEYEEDSLMLRGNHDQVAQDLLTITGIDPYGGPHEILGLNTYIDQMSATGVF